MELIGIIIGAIAVLLASWASLWYKLGKLETSIKHCNEKFDGVKDKVDHLIAKGG